MYLNGQDKPKQWQMNAKKETSIGDAGVRGNPDFFLP